MTEKRKNLLSHSEGLISKIPENEGIILKNLVYLVIARFIVKDLTNCRLK